MNLQTAIDPAKAAAGRRAAEFVADGMIVGLGTGSTADYAIRRLAERVNMEGLRMRGIATSLRTELLAKELLIPVIDVNGVHRIDLTIDGADEIDRSFNMIKGGGGALLREKVVARASRLEIIVIDQAKLVDRLGARWPVPTEVVPFGWTQAARALRELGCEPKLRGSSGHQPFQTDNGNYVLDLHFSRIDDPAGLERRINSVPGVVDCGLFIDLAHRLIVGHPDGRCDVIERSAR
ncbi:MAG: ribose-5-phosphate isomerase RpiA [Nitrospirota bacterium]